MLTVESSSRRTEDRGVYALDYPYQTKQHPRQDAARFASIHPVQVIPEW